MINKEEIIQQLEARGASKETIDKIKNATEGEAVDLAWEQLGWFERMWGRASWWIVVFLFSLVVWSISEFLSRFHMSDTWKWVVAVIAALVLVWILRNLWRLIWRLILATWIALISTHAQNEAERYSNEMDRLIAQGFTGDELLAEMRREFPIPRRRPWYVERWAQFYGA
jgi:hypothetical protein